MIRSLIILIVAVALIVSSANGQSIDSHTSLKSIFIHRSVLVTSPNWIGTFSTTPLCDRNVCCCLDGEVQINQHAYFFMTISGKLAGQCKGLPGFFLPTMKPSTFTTTLPIVGEVTLSEDSSILSAKSPLGSQCNGRAVRKE